LKWSIDPAYFTGSDVQCDFISYSWPFELVTVPFFTKWIPWLIDAAISAINGELDDVSHIIIESIF
jgi:hypothetical protein